MLIESLLLSGAGGVLGVVTGSGLLNALRAVAPPTLPRIEEVRLDAEALLFALGITIVAGLLFGILPALMASGADGRQLVVHATRGGVASPHRLRRALLVGELALAVLLLCGAGLMIRTLAHLTAADPGFAPDHLITMKYAISGDDGWTAARIKTFHDDVIARTRALPGVVNAGLTLSLPIEGSNWGSVFIVGDQPVPPRADLPSSAFTQVTPGYFAALGLRLRAGRLLTDEDNEHTPRVAVVNETFAKRFWPNENPIGKKLKQGWPEWTTAWQEIVGVVNDVKLEGIESTTPMQVYMPLAQAPSRSVILIARLDAARPATAAAIQSVITGLNDTVPVYGVRTMDEVMGSRVDREAALDHRLRGVRRRGADSRRGRRVRRGVARRRQLHARGRAEDGARRDAGSGARVVPRAERGHDRHRRRDWRGRDAHLSRFLRDLLFEVEPNDAATMCAAAGLLFAVSIAACYLPALRATRVESDGRPAGGLTQAGCHPGGSCFDRAGTLSAFGSASRTTRSSSSR